MKKFLLLFIVLICLCFCGCDNIKYTVINDEVEIQQLYNKVNEASLSFDKYINLDLSITASDAKTGLVKPLNLKGSLKAVIQPDNSQMQIILNNAGGKSVANIFDDGNDCYIVLNEYKIYGQTVFNDSIDKEASNLNNIEKLFLDTDQLLFDKFEINLNEVDTIKKNVSSTNQTTKLLFKIDPIKANNVIKKMYGIEINLSEYKLSETYLGVTMNNNNVITELCLETEAEISSTPVSIKFIAKTVYFVPTIENTIDMTLFTKEEK